LLIMPIVSFAQFDQVYIDSLQTALNNAANDTIRLEINRQLGFYYQNSYCGIALIYHQEQLKLSKKLNLKLWEADGYQQVGYCHRQLDNLPASYESYMEGLKIAEDPSSSENGWGYHNFSFSESPDDARQSIVGMIYYELGPLYQRTRSYDEVLTHLFQALRIGEKLKNKKILSLSTRDIGRNYFARDQPDSAFKYYKKALYHYEDSPYQTAKGQLHLFISEYYANEQKIDSAMVSAKTAMSLAAAEPSLGLLVQSQLFIGSLFLQTSQLDSALIYTEKAVETSQWINSKRSEGLAYVQLASIYRLQEQNGPAYEYLNQGSALLDSINDAYINRLLQFQNIEFDQKIRLTELEKENELTKNRIRVYSLLSGLLVFLVIGLILYRGNRRKQKANQLLEKQKEEIQTALNLLKSTQAQLVQQEKLASLGQLTAGIAHEIKNPLNFVNNFSDVSLEMIDEALEELGKSTQDVHKAETVTILMDIKTNLAKIHEHGSRADGIVQSMLMHSRGGSGKMEPTDLNAVVKEYVNLAFHGMRAGKDPINVDIDLQLSEKVGDVPLIAEDFSRVILNLTNNAFDAMQDKLTGSGGTKTAYVPKLSVRTKSENGQITHRNRRQRTRHPRRPSKTRSCNPFLLPKRDTGHRPRTIHYPRHH
jgi:two-component system, NtrC family, sensor kinase